MRGWQVIFWLGVILAAMGWFAGPSRPGTAFRMGVSRDLEKAGAAMADGPVGDAGRWVAANAKWLRIAVGVLGTVVLLWGNDVSTTRLLWSLVLVTVMLAVVQVLVGAGGGKRGPAQLSAGAPGSSPAIRRTVPVLMCPAKADGPDLRHQL